MSGAGFIVAINIFVAALLAASFLTIAAYDRRRASARWFGASYMLGMAYFAIESAIPLFTDAIPVVLVAFATFLAATAVFNIGLARKYHALLPGWAILAFCVAATIGVYLVQDLERQSLVRMMAYQLPYAAMQITGAAIIAVSRDRRERLDIAMMCLLAFSAFQFASKPFLAHALGGWGADAQTYLQSTYAMASQSIGSVLGMAIALLMLVILVRDILAEASERSQTDTLSGLLNRGGFESRATTALTDAVRSELKASLVICDLDHFKSINDTFGHPAGDRVIIAFAGFLQSTIASHYVAGRIGGEEFAILLPGTNLVAARLFAEGARTAFSGLAIEGLPAGKKVTASFGVAEHAPGESFAELLARADKALYLAKNSGRDCVKIAPRPAARRADGTAITL